ncbi:MAG: NAD(P)-dependent oxidoreductase [Candidatus Liptonbacteria bacterium]|nr:NAD(P)-dependent oxidoreductase [Candidatus Liptonbacteria bacterium]
MQHKATFFNIEPCWGEEGMAHLKNNEKLREAGVKVSFSADTLDSAHIPTDDDFDIAGIFMDSKIDETTIAALPNLKFIATLSTGYDHIDLEPAAARGIPVSSVPAYGENTVAEFAFALILALSRKICEARERVHNEGRFTTEGLVGFDLAGKTLGIVGTGRIGKHAVRMAKGFGMNVVAFDTYHDDEFAKEMGFSYASLEELLAQSDIVTIHCPYLPATHHIINKENIGLMKRGAYLINTARGGIVETEALVTALQSGALAGAGLDVIEEEGEMKDELALLNAGHPKEEELKTILLNHVLMKMPNVILTPHNAFNSKEALLRILDTTIDNIVAFMNGTPANVVR